MSKTYSTLISAFGKALTAHLRPYRRANARARASEQLVQRWDVELPVSGKLTFRCPSGRSIHDVETPYEDEPETIKWLNAMPKRASFWDVGANIGLYALYAAKVKNAQVNAFEPSASSFSTLVNNIEINKLENNIIPFCIALDDKESISRLFMNSTEAGASMHSFDIPISAQGEINVRFAQPTMGTSADFLHKKFKLNKPEFVKIDVDGNEARVLRGGRELFMKFTNSIIIEVESFVDKRLKKELTDILENMGFWHEQNFHPNPSRNWVFRNQKFS